MKLSKIFLLVVANLEVKLLRTSIRTHKNTHFLIKITTRSFVIN